MPSKKSPLMMNIDKNFVSVSIDEGDEYFPNGIFVFNITKMLRFITDNKSDIDFGSISIEKYRRESSNINEAYLDSVDLTSPVILAEICPGMYNLIDGHHRIEKAFRMGVENIPAYKLKAKQHLPYLTTSEAYHSYIEYWNSKILDGYKPF